MSSRGLSLARRALPMIYEVLFPFVLIQTDKCTLNSGWGQCSGAEGCGLLEGELPSPFSTQRCGTCATRLGTQVDLWPGNSNLTQVGMYTRVHTRLSVSATFPANTALLHMYSLTVPASSL